MTPQPQSHLHKFFTEYAAISLGSEPERLAELYGDGFLVAGPQASAVFKNDEQFLSWLRQVHEFNKAAGMVSLAVVSISELRLSAQFTIATIQWGATFQETGDDLITFKITYIVQEQGDALKVLGYISHEDQLEAMRERGLL
jgi:hypothetical protein